MVIQTGTIAAVCVGFGRFVGVLVPGLGESHYIVAPLHLSAGYAVSLSRAQLLAVLLIALLTWVNSRGIEYGRLLLNVFTTAKVGALLALIVLGLGLSGRSAAFTANLATAWQHTNPTPIAPGLDATSLAGLLIAMAIAQVGSLFAADAWNNITFTAGEVRDPRRDIPLSLALGTTIVMTLFLAANLSYFFTLTVEQVQQAVGDRVASASLEVLPGVGAALMAGGTWRRCRWPARRSGRTPVSRRPHLAPLPPAAGRCWQRPLLRYPQRARRTTRRRGRSGRAGSG